MTRQKDWLWLADAQENQTHMAQASGSLSLAKGLEIN